MIAFAFLVIFAAIYGYVHGSAGADYEIVPQIYLRWNYTRMNRNCTDADGGRNPCKDIRICTFAAASIAMGGWPALCGWAGKGVPKVCCGLPLVLGNRLIKKVNEEKARKRRCGTRTYQSDISETEAKFFKIVKSLPPVDISEPDKFDPPLAFAEPMVSPIGGVPSRQGVFPWMVSIRKRGTHWCGGTLIDRSHILSAAHCFVTNNQKPDPNDYTVHVGNIHVDEGYPYSVKKVVIHPEYVHNLYYHDIAMLTLSEEILHPMIAHICLPSPELSAADLTGKNTTLLGWGDTSFGGRSTPILHIVDNLPVVPFKDCKKAYRRVAAGNLPQGLTEDFICAGEEEGGKDACQKDSGGPLMFKYNDGTYPSWNIPWTLVGIVSFGFMCGEPGFPGVYTRVSSHMDWITQNMNE